jgi:hypothetical protein
MKARRAIRGTAFCGRTVEAGVYPETRMLPGSVCAALGCERGRS